jgi:hypothetical protein
LEYNLVFSGIPEPSNIKEENTEEVVKTFIGRELEIDPTTIPFQNVHGIITTPVVVSLSWSRCAFFKRLMVLWPRAIIKTNLNWGSWWWRSTIYQLTIYEK